MDSTKIREELGWSPRHDLDSGLRKTVSWYLENLDWVAKISKGADFQDWLKKNYEKRGKQ
jgi:dTDP-glucose 4,6-dehydratase